MGGRILPVNFVWDAEHRLMIPEPRFARVCDRQFVDREVYPLAPVEPRSRQSHNHYFATLHDIWENLPESLAPAFPTIEHMRKWALIEADYCDVTIVDCGTVASAKQMGTAARNLDAFARIQRFGSSLHIKRAQSQSAQAMGREVFQDSKTKVLDICAAMVGPSSATFKKEAAKRVPPEKKAAPADPEFKRGGVRERAMENAERGGLR